MKLQYISYTQLTLNFCLVYEAMPFLIVTTSKAFCVVPLMRCSGHGGKQAVTMATTVARHKLSDCDSFSLSAWFSPEK